MGSGSKRKSNDRPIIRTPKQVSGNGSGEEGGSRPKGSDTCPPSFVVELPSGEGSEGQKLVLKLSEDIISIILNNEEITTLSKNKSIEISNCIKAGFQYHGVVRVKKDGVYGEFRRT